MALFFVIASSFDGNNIKYKRNKTRLILLLKTNSKLFSKKVFKNLLNLLTISKKKLKKLPVSIKKSARLGFLFNTPLVYIIRI